MKDKLRSFCYWARVTWGYMPLWAKVSDIAITTILLLSAVLCWIFLS